MTVSSPIGENTLARLSAHLEQQMGLRFPRERWAEMERGIRSAAHEFGFPDARSFAQRLLASPLSRRQVEVLASHLTVGETYFFREKPAFEAVQTRILPELIRQRRGDGEGIRIWSAGCASGEEPYSIAIALDRVTGGDDANKVMILATDINPRSLDKAAAGFYSDWSFRDAPTHLKQNYFWKQGRRFEILSKVKQRVLFSFLNLAEDAYPSLASNTNAIDVIFCRNVLMYFAPEQAASVVRKFHRCLVDGGWLIVSPCEASTDLFSGFAAIHLPGVTLYRKSAAVPVRGVEWFTVPESVRPEPEAAFEFAPAWSGKESLIPPTIHSPEPASAVPAAPQSAPTRCEVARSLYAEGNYEMAVEVLESGEDRTAPTPEEMALAARSLANQGKLVEALARCERAIDSDKLQAKYYYLRAAILLEQGERTEARRALKQTLYLNPNFVLGHVALANFDRQEGDAVSSGRHMEIAHRLLSARPREEILPESDGMTAGRLMEIIEAQRVTRQTLSKDSREGRRIAQPNIDSARTYERGRR